METPEESEDEEDGIPLFKYAQLRKKFMEQETDNTLDDDDHGIGKA